MPQIIFIGAPAGATWTDSYAGAAHDTDEDEWNGYTIRQLIPASALLVSGTKVRVTLQAALTASTTGATLTKVYVGHRAGSGDAYDFASTPVQLLFGGSATVTLNVNGELKVSDEATFSLNEATDLIIAAYCSTGGNLGFLSGATGFTAYYKSGDDAVTTNATGYTSITTSRYLVRKIEVQ